MGSPFISRAVAAGVFLFSSAAPRLAASQAVVRGILYDDATGARLRGTVMLVDPRTDEAVVHATTDSLGADSFSAR